MFTVTKKSKGLNGKSLVTLLMMAVLLMAFNNMMASENIAKTFGIQSEQGGIKLAGTTWNGIGKGTISDGGNTMGFNVKMTIEFVNETDANMSLDVSTVVSGVETVAQKDVKGTLKYTFDGKSKGSMDLKRIDMINGAIAKRPFTFTYNNNGSITLDCWLFEGIGITRYELTKLKSDKDVKAEEDKSVAIDTITGIDIIEEEIFQMVEEMPSFPGGEAKMMEFIAKNLKYPQIARETGIQGRVFVNFVVERDGSITNAKVSRGIGGGCDDEAVRVIQSMPKWKPGKQRGKAVRVSYLVTVNFRL